MALRKLGYPPLLVDLEAVRDSDHVLAVYRVNGHWGALAKSDYAGLRSREPVYATIRELAMSYFEHYYNAAGEKTLRAYSRPVNLARFDRSLAMDDHARRGLGHPRTPVRDSPHQHSDASRWSASSRAWIRACTRPAASAESWSRYFAGRPPLPLEQHHAGRHADVQRRHLSRHRDAHQEVAALGHVFVQPAAFAAQHDRGRPW